jgi:uncharacterized protein YegL
MSKKTDYAALVLLDRSASMATRWTEAVASVNAYAEGLGKEKATKNAPITVAVFDSVSFDVIRTNVIAKDWNPISDTELLPRGNTPLNDAIGKLNGIVEKSNVKRASVVIMTDGEENASTEVTKKAAGDMLEAMRKRGYEVLFLGIDFDNWHQASGYGNLQAQTMSVGKGQVTNLMTSNAVYSSNYASTGMVSNINQLNETDDDKK